MHQVLRDWVEKLIAVLEAFSHFERLHGPIRTVEVNHSWGRLMREIQTRRLEILEMKRA